MKTKVIIRRATTPPRESRDKNYMTVRRSKPQGHLIASAMHDWLADRIDKRRKHND